MNPRGPFLLITGDFVRTGGMDAANYHLADFIARQESALHLVSHHVDPALLSYPNVVWHRVPRPGGVQFLGERFLRSRGRRVAEEKALSGAASVVNGGNCPLNGLNWVHYVHAATEPHDGLGGWRKWKNRLSHRLARREEAEALQRARVLVVNSQRTRRDLMAHYQLPEDRIRAIYYGTDPALFHPADQAAKEKLRAKLDLPQGKFLQVFVGALSDRRKGFDTLFGAWQAVGTKFRQESELVVVGRGAELPLWQKLAAQMPDGGSIHFLGFRQDVPDILRACDALIAPARYEAFGLAVQQALCCGIPALVSRGAGVAELVPASLEALLLDDPENIPELVEKMHLLQARREEFSTAAEQLSGLLRAHTWDDMARSIQALL